MTDSRKRYRFGDITLDLDQHRIWRGEAPVQLAKLSFEFLRVLVEAAPRVVTQAELIESVWGDRRIVTPETLAKRVMLLRRSIGDDATHPTYIEVVRGIGYRLLPPVQLLEHAPAPEEPVEGAPQTAIRSWSRRAYAAVLCVAALVALAYVYAPELALQSTATAASGAEDATHSLAVMPLVNFSADREDELFAAGLSEELRGRIADVDNVSVVGSSASLAMQRDGHGPLELKARFGIDQIVEGSLRRSGERLRVDVRLVDAARGFTLWSQSFDRAVGDTFATQEEIATAVAKALQLRIRSRSSDLRYGGTDELEAYEHYLRGRATWNVDPPYAVQEFERALAIDPEYRQPWGYLTYAYGWVLDMATTREDARHALERMQHAASRAVLALSDSWEGHSALAWGHIANKRWLEAHEAIETAREIAAASGAQEQMLRPYALYLYEVGRLAEALPLLEQRRDLDPLDVFTSANLQQTLILLGRTEAARADYQRNASLPGIRDVVAELDLPWLMKHGDEAAVAAAFENASPRVRALGAVRHSPAEALRMLRDASDSPGYRMRREFAVLATLAGHYGDDALAVELLRDAFLGEGYALYFMIWHPALQSARRTEAFAQFLHELGIVELWRQTGRWGDYCRPSGAAAIECR